MSEADLRASTNALTGTTANDWPMVAHANGVGDIPDLRVGWDANNMQYAGVLIWTGPGNFGTRIKLVDFDDVDVTPNYTWPTRDSTDADGAANVALINPNGVTPPAIGGTSAHAIVLAVTPILGPWPAAQWEMGIFERVPYDPPPPPDPGPGLGPCPERPPWPYLDASITAYQGPFGVTRGARR